MLVFLKVVSLVNIKKINLKGCTSSYCCCASSQLRKNHLSGLDPSIQSYQYLTASKGPITENCHLSFCDLDIHTPGMEWDYIAISHYLCNSHNMVMNFSHRWQILISVVQSSVSLNVSLCRNKILKILDNSHHTSGTSALLYDRSIFKW